MDDERLENMPFRPRPFIIAAFWHTAQDERTREAAMEAILREDYIYRIMFKIKEWGC